MSGPVGRQLFPVGPFLVELGPLIHTGCSLGGEGKVDETGRVVENTRNRKEYQADKKCKLLLDWIWKEEWLQEEGQRRCKRRNRNSRRGHSRRNSGSMRRHIIPRQRCSARFSLTDRNA